MKKALLVGFVLFVTGCETPGSFMCSPDFKGDRLVSLNGRVFRCRAGVIEEMPPGVISGVAPVPGAFKPGFHFNGSNQLSGQDNTMPEVKP